MGSWVALDTKHIPAPGTLPKMFNITIFLFPECLVSLESLFLHCLLQGAYLTFLFKTARTCCLLS
jgi:hypothetical protein